jgi:hypothetical protein
LAEFLVKWHSDAPEGVPEGEGIAGEQPEKKTFNLTTAPEQADVLRRN